MSEKETYPPTPSKFDEYRAYWSLNELWHEAWANMLTPRSKMRLLLYVALILGAVVPVINTFEYAQTDQQVRAGVKNGANVYAITVSGYEAGISLQSCENLAQNSQVIRSGLLERVGRVNLVPLARNIEVYRASPGLFPQLVTAEVLVGSQLLSPGHHTQLRLENNFTQTWEASTLPDQPAGLPNKQNAVIRWGAKGYGQRCVLQLDPWQNPQEVVAQLAASLRIRHGNVDIDAYAKPITGVITSFLERNTKYFPLFLGLIGGLLGLVMTRARSTELAAYRFAGTGSLQTRILTILEQIIAASFALLSGTLMTFIAWFLIPVRPSMLGWLLVMALSWILLTPLAAPKMSNPGSLLKER